MTRASPSRPRPEATAAPAIRRVEIPEIAETRAMALPPLATYWPSSASAADLAFKVQLELFAEFGLASYLFVLQRGVYCRPGARPHGVKKLRDRECFKNAASLAMERPDLTYVEGFGSSIVPIHHAWCIDRAGAVVDPTWDQPEDRCYFGVPMNLPFVAQWVKDAGCWGVLGGDLFHPKLLTTPLPAMVPPEFLEELTARPASPRLDRLAEMTRETGAG